MRQHCSFARAILRGFISYVIAAGLTVTATAQTTWQVDIGNCPNVGDGSPGNPFCSIQSAIDVAAGGDLVLVAAGSYNEAIDFLGKAIIVRGEGLSASTTVIGSGADDSIVKFTSGEGPNSVLDGFTIASGIGSEVEVEPGVFEKVGGGILIDSSSPSLLNCVFKSNAAQRGGGAYLAGADPTFVNCLFITNSAEEGGGLYCTDNCNPRLINCVLQGNTATSDGGGMFNTAGCCGGTPSHPVVDNSILWGNTPNQIVDDVGSASTVSFSDVLGGWSGAGSNNIAANPMFINTLAGDLRLLSGSPCIDAGQDSAVPLDSFDLDADGILLESIPNDLEGSSRFRNAAVEMGAFESDHCPADTNGDGVIDHNDYLIMNTNWGTDPPCSSPCPSDINNDGAVSVEDLHIHLATRGDCPEPITAPPCPADFTDDGLVDVQDLIELLAAWGSNPGHIADIDDDGDVGVSDLIPFLAAWGSCPTF